MYVCVCVSVCVYMHEEGRTVKSKSGSTQISNHCITLKAMAFWQLNIEDFLLCKTIFLLLLVYS